MPEQQDRTVFEVLLDLEERLARIETKTHKLCIANGVKLRTSEDYSEQPTEG